MKFFGNGMKKQYAGLPLSMLISTCLSSVTMAETSRSFERFDTDTLDVYRSMKGEVIAQREVQRDGGVLVIDVDLGAVGDNS